MRLLPLVLLRHDDRVQRAYTDWQARIVRYEDVGEFTKAAALRSLFDDSVQLSALVRALGLQRYQRWLPHMLRWEFQRALEGADRLEVTVPQGLSWSLPPAAAGEPRQNRVARPAPPPGNVQRLGELFRASEPFNRPLRSIRRGCEVALVADQREMVG